MFALSPALISSVCLVCKRLTRYRSSRERDFERVLGRLLLALANISTAVEPHGHRGYRTYRIPWRSSDPAGSIVIENPCGHRTFSKSGRPKDLCLLPHARRSNVTLHQLTNCRVSLSKAAGFLRSDSAERLNEICSSLLSH